MAMDAATTAFIDGFLSSLKPGENIYQAIRQTINQQAFPEPQLDMKVQTYVLVGGHIIILVLSVVGIIARYYRKSAWLFARDDNGFLRPNTAITTQISFAIYSLFFTIDSFAFSLQSRASGGAFVVLLLTFIPLGFALHFTTWATTLAPSTSLKFLSSSNRSRNGIATRGRLFSWIAIIMLILFVASVIVPTVLLALIHADEYRSVNELYTQLDEAEAANTGIAGLVILLPTYTAITTIGDRLLSRYRAICSCYLGWSLLWMLLYIPAALRLLFTLENKKRRFSRSIRSLRVLDDIVSGDREITDDFKVKQDNEKNLRQSRMDAELGLGIQIAARSTYSPRLKGFSHSPPSSPGLGVSVYSGKDPLSHGTETTSSAHFGSELELVKDMPDSEKKSEAAWSTESLDNPLKKDGLEKERNLLKKVREKKAEHDRLKMEEKNSASKQKASRSAAHIDDLQRQLGRTERMFKTILVQFIVTLAIYLPYFSLLVCTYIFSFQHLQRIFVPWTGWSFVVPGLAGSFTFALFSLRGPRLVPIAPVAAAVPRPEEEDYAPAAANAPVLRIVDPSGKSSMSNQGPRSMVSSMVPASIMQRTLGVFGKGSSATSVNDGPFSAFSESSGVSTSGGNSPPQNKNSWFPGSRFARRGSGST